MSRKEFFAWALKALGIAGLCGVGVASTEDASLARIRLWWEPVYLRNWGGNTTYQNKQDFAADELRRKLGPLMRQFFRGYSHCDHCGWPWPLTDDPHSVPLVPASEVDDRGFYLGRGCFTLCNRCWKWLRSVEGGDERIFALHQADRVRLWPDTSEDELNVAINAEFQREDSRGFRMISSKPDSFTNW